MDHLKAGLAHRWTENAKQLRRVLTFDAIGKGHPAQAEHDGSEKSYLRQKHESSPDFA
ncbi:hypothetical protein IH992_13710 [Candidatus Poribacteria bacterium]|nr:hypothetical protein [Candidatus Poribacteria bacterium]